MKASVEVIRLRGPQLLTFIDVYCEVTIVLQNCLIKSINADEALTRNEHTIDSDSISAFSFGALAAHLVHKAQNIVPFNSSLLILLEHKQLLLYLMVSCIWKKNVY